MGGLLCTKYNDSPQAFLEANMPPEEWARLRPWKFSHAPQNYWDDDAHHKLAFNAVRNHIGADDANVDQWYGVTKDLIESIGLRGLLCTKYNNSPQAFLEANMPPEEWARLRPWKFGLVSAQEQWAVHVVQLHLDFKLLGADCLNKSLVSFGPSRYRWDLVIRHLPSGKTFVLEIDGEQHFYWKEGSWTENHRRDEEKLKLRPDHPPSCTDHVDFVARISFRMRSRGLEAISDLLQVVAAASTTQEFVCLPDDVSLYTDIGVPKLLDGDLAQSTHSF